MKKRCDDDPAMLCDETGDGSDDARAIGAGNGKRVAVGGDHVVITWLWLERF